MSKGQLIQFIEDNETKLNKYAKVLPQSSELALLDKEELIEFLILLEGELYFKYNEDKDIIKKIFDRGRLE